MWMYDIFQGVQLMVANFATESCFRDSERQNVIEINHCRKGRFERVFDNKNYLYLGGGYCFEQSDAPTDCVIFSTELLLWL